MYRRRRAGLVDMRNFAFEMMMLLLYIIYSISNVMCHEVHQNEDDYKTNANVTTLYPVENNFTRFNENHSRLDVAAKSDPEDKIVLDHDDRASGKLREQDFIKEFDESIQNYMTKDEDDTMAVQKNFNENATYSNKMQSDKMKPKEPKMDTTTWKIDTPFSKLDKQKSVIFRAGRNDSNDKALHATGKEFKPSPLLGHFYDETAFVVPTQPTIESFFPMTSSPSSFINSPEDFYRLTYKPPSVNYPEPIDIPYQFENNLHPRAKNWKYNSGIEPKPTVEAPEKIPAGGLYKFPDAFKEKPGSEGDGDNFGLDFKDEDKEAKENSLKKRGNPWKSLLNLVTALLPIGIIISALTPSVVTLESTGNNRPYPSRFSRRSDGAAELPPISESCKRRLLCELHSDSNYAQSPRRHCHKVQCQDPEALNKLLRWLLMYHRSRSFRPAEHDRRGYIT